MSLAPRRDGGNGNRLVSRDPFSLARDLFGWTFDDQARAPVAFVPRFEVKDRADAFVFRADLPGVKEADLDISLHDGVLTINGSRADEQKKEGETYFVYERQYGTFSRSFALPDIADPDRVEAAMAHGVLTVTVGKKAEAKPRKIGLKKE